MNSEWHAPGPFDVVRPDDTLHSGGGEDGRLRTVDRCSGDDWNLGGLSLSKNPGFRATAVSP